MPRPRSRVRYSVTAPGLAARMVSRTVPSVDPWTAGEMFVSPHVEERRRGLAILTGSEAARRSSLTPHLLASRVDEPDLGLRAQIVAALADYYEVRGREFRYPAELRAAVTVELQGWDRPQVLALLALPAAAAEGRLKLPAEVLRRLFQRIPNASSQLTRLAGDRALEVRLRQAAVQVIGLVGFTDAAPALSGLCLRLEGRSAGQLTMLFAPRDFPEDQALLPALRETLRLLEDDE